VAFVASARAITCAIARAVWAALRRFLSCLAWTAVAAFAGAGGCWCCGYVGRESWIRVGSMARRPMDGSWWVTDDVDVAVTREAARGIREIEVYLAAASDRQQPPQSSANEA
jgi:hypothetical protein